LKTGSRTEASKRSACHGEYRRSGCIYAINISITGTNPFRMIDESSMEAPAIAVPLSSGEIMRKKLAVHGLLNKELKPEREGEKLILPLKEEVGAEEVLMALDVRLHPASARRSFTPFKKQKTSYKDIITGAGSIPERLFPLLPTSYDVIGKIIVLRLDAELEPYREEVGAALLEVHHNCQTVAVDRGVGGEFRIRKLETIAGDKNLKTLHTELGVKLEIDLEKLYFSPRLSMERQRVAESIDTAEFILDAFAGAGPFSIVLAGSAHPRPKKIVAVDINPHAVEYLRLNVMRNRCDDIVEIEEEDAGVVLTKYATVSERERPNRIIMNLPHDAFRFLPAAVRAIKHGGIINYYAIIGNEEREHHMEEILEMGEAAGRRIEIVFSREVRNYSPSMGHFAFDLRVH